MPIQEGKQLDEERRADSSAYRTDPSPTLWNWWYQDADFDNGYVLAASLHFGAPRPPGGLERRFIEFQIFDPEGERHFVRPKFSLEECRASEEKCDVVMGNNFYRAEDLGHRFFFLDGDLGCDLLYQPIISAFQPDLSWIPAVSPDFRYFIMSPRAKVSGSITVQGKTIKVQGNGYQEHTSDTVPMGSIELPGIDNAFWGRIYYEDWSFLWQSGAMFVGKGNQLILESIGATTHMSDLTTKDTGVERPEKIVLRANDPGRAEGEIKFKVVKVLVFMDLLKRFKPFQKWFMCTYFGRAAYFRYLLEYDMDLSIFGEKVTGKGECWCEHHKMPT